MTKKITELDSKYEKLELMNTDDILININYEDNTIAKKIKKIIPILSEIVNEITEKLKNGGRLFYIGSGTSGRLGVLDAAECPPTYGVSENLVIGIIAGGDIALKKAVEGAEDNAEQGWNDLQAYDVSNKDFVIGLSASGYTPYTIGALQECSKNKISTACLTCNKSTPLANESKHKIEIIVGPEFVTGSTRMKAGTAQKIILNMISTSVMIKLGKVKGNKMIDLQLNNNKLINRAINIISKELKISENEAYSLLMKYGNIRRALENY